MQVSKPPLQALPHLLGNSSMVCASQQASGDVTRLSAKNLKEYGVPKHFPSSHHDFLEIGGALHYGTKYRQYPATNSK